MSVTRRETLRLFGSGLAATALSLRAGHHDYLPAEKALDRTSLLQVLGAVPIEAPPLAALRVERADLGDVVREKLTYAVEPGERVPAFILLPKAPSTRHPAILCHHGRLRVSVRRERVRWTEPAARDLTQICDYIEEDDTSSTARRVAISIYER
jgi:hypothetical protein